MREINSKHIVKQMIKDYLIYFITTFILATLFFSFMSIGSKYNTSLNNSIAYNWDIFKDIINYSIILISLVFSILIAYINTCLFKERIKDFTIYITLGVERRQIISIFFKKIFLVMLLGVCAGCIAGTFLSQVIINIILVVIGQKIYYKLHIYYDTIIITFVFFVTIFIITNIVNVFKLSNATLLNLLNESEKSEYKNTSKIRYFISCIIMITSIIFIVFVIQDFWSIGRSYEGIIPTTKSNLFQILTFIAILLAIYSCYYTLSFIIILLKNNKIFKYTHLRIILINNIQHKILSSIKILLTTTLLLTVAITTFIITPLSVKISEGYLEYRIPYDVIIFNNYRFIDKVEDIPQINYSFVDEILIKNNIEIEESVSLESYFIWEKDFSSEDTRKTKWDFPRTAIRLSDFNKLRKMLDYEPITLEANEFAMHISNEETIESFQSRLDTEYIQLDNKQIVINSEKVYNDSLGDYLFNRNNSDIMILPDSICDSLLLATTGYYLNTITPIPYDSCSSISRDIENTFELNYPYLFEKYEEKYMHYRDYQNFIGSRLKVEETSDIIVSNMMIRMLGIYIGIVFFIICLTIFSIHQITHYSSNAITYNKLHQIGVDQEAISRLINTQVGVYFTIPILFSVLFSGILIETFLIRFGYKVYSYIGINSFLYSIIVPISIIIFIIVLYYIGTISFAKIQLKNVVNK